MGHDQRADHTRHVAAGKIVRLEPSRRDIAAEARLHGHDSALHDRPRVDLPQAHAEQFEEPHGRLRPVGLKPELPIVEDEQQHRQGQESEHEARSQ